MAHIGTTWDYDLKEEVFRLTGDKGYLHKTQTSIKELSRKTGYDDLLAYCLVEFEVSVNQNIGNSYIVIYDNGKAIPFIISNTEYTQYTWTENTSKKTIKVKLGYDVQHNITARYMGNKYGLPSVSVNVPIFEALPNKYKAELSSTLDNFQFNSSTIEIPIRLTSLGEDGFLNTADKLVNVYENGRHKGSTTLHAIQGDTYVDGTVTIDELTDGKHNLYFLFDGDDDNAYCEMFLNIKVGYNLEFIHYPSATVECISDLYSDWNVVKVKVTDWDGSPIVDEPINVTGVHSLTENTNSEGIATFVENNVHQFVASYQNSTTDPKSIPCLIPTIIENSITPQYLAEGKTNTVSVKVVESTWKEGYGLGRLTNIPVFVSDGVNSYRSQLSSDGVASFNYTDTSETDVTLTSRLGDITAKSTHEVVWQYWNVVKGEIVNRDYTVLKGELIDVPNGVKIKPDDTGIAIIAFGDGSDGFGGYQIDFDNYQEMKNVQLAPGNWRKNAAGYISWYFHPNFSGKEVYMGKRYPFTLKRWKGGDGQWRFGVWQGSRSLLGTNTSSADGGPVMRLIFRKATDSVIINNIKIKKIR